MSANLLELKVNAKTYALDEIPGEMLSDLLRDRLNLTGTKIGCNESECGACTVLVDGDPVLSCSYPAARAHGKSIITIEGVAGLNNAGALPAQSKLHPLQQAFIAYGAVQCGFCIPGQIMTAVGLLMKDAAPSQEAIKTAFKDTLCRCGGYVTIIQAIQAAAQALQTGQPVQPPQPVSAQTPRKAVGRMHIRPDAEAKVNGAALYTDDLKFEQMLHARVKRAMTPSGILRQLDISKALALPGVQAVLTAADIPGSHTHGLVIPDWPSLIGIGERIRTVGDAVAIVAAETREIAGEALQLIEMDVEILPVVTNAVLARSADAPQIHASGNLLKHIKVRKGDVEQGFAESELILEQTFSTPPHDHAFIEPECSIARPLKDGRMEIYVGSQIPYSDRSQVARALGWAEERVHVIGMLIGGGFGGKEDIAGQIHAALLAHVTGRPVKLLYDRQESLLCHPKRHATQITVKLGADRNGRLRSIQTELYGDTGAYASLGEKVMTRATTHSSGPYEVSHVKADCYAMYTNNPPAGAFRGFGVMQSAFAVETALEMLADQLALDPVEIRKLNALHVGSITNTGQRLKDSAGLLECIEKADQEMRRITPGDPFKPRSVPGNAHLKRAWGFAVGFKNTGLGGGAPDKASAEVELRRDGTFQVRTSSAELGQGLPAVLQLIAAEELDDSPQRIAVLLSDTDLTPDGGPTTASRQTYVTGNAVRHAAQAMRQMLVNDLAERYDTPPEQIRFIEGLAQVDQHAIPLSRVAQDMHRDGRVPQANYTYWAPETRPLGQEGSMHFAYSFAAQAAEVEVNTHTGEVQVLRVIAANDVGFAINPLGLRGQVEGGVIMGIGDALTENFIVEEGQVITDRLARYRIPSIKLTPQITSIIVEHPTADGPYGAKGVGEIVLIPTIPAITNAIFHATGYWSHTIPVDQEEILKFIQSQGRP